MYLNLNPNAVEIEGLELKQLIDLARRHGFEGIAPPLGQIAAMDEPRRAAQMVQAAGLRWGAMGMTVEFRASEDQFEAGMRALPNAAALAAQIGCTRCSTWLMPCDDALDYEANFKHHARRLALVARVLAEQGVRFGIEFVGPRTLRETKKYSFVHTLDQCLALCAAIGHDCGVLFDSFHWYTSGGTEDDITKKLTGRIVDVHVNDAIPGRGPDGQLDRERALPCDTGVIDLEAFVRGLKAIDYDGPITVEPMIQSFAQEPPDQVAAKVAASLRRMMGEQ